MQLVVTARLKAGGEFVDVTRQVKVETGDGLIDRSDRNVLVLEILGSRFGDANLDRVTDGSDFSIWQANRFNRDGGPATGRQQRQRCRDQGELRNRHARTSRCVSRAPPEYRTLRDAPPKGGGVERWLALGEILSDCRAVLVSGVG